APLMLYVRWSCNSSSSSSSSSSSDSDSGDGGAVAIAVAAAVTIADRLWLAWLLAEWLGWCLNHIQFEFIRIPKTHSLLYSRFSSKVWDFSSNYNSEQQILFTTLFIKPQIKLKITKITTTNIIIIAQMMTTSVSSDGLFLADFLKTWFDKK
ncbi:hypothetical protein DOY81_000710, partial [Sarcophaga bullata]